MSICHLCSSAPYRAEEGIIFPGDDITDSCEPSSVGVGNFIQFSRRSVSAGLTTGRGFFFSFCSSGWPQKNHTDPLCLLSAGHVIPSPPSVVLVFLIKENVMTKILTETHLKSHYQ